MVYTELLNVVLVDQGSVLTSHRFKHLVQKFCIYLRLFGFEGHHAVGDREKYHEPYRNYMKISKTVRQLSSKPIFPLPPKLWKML